MGKRDGRSEVPFIGHPHLALHARDGLVAMKLMPKVTTKSNTASVNSTV